jgi:hypothetical protein
MHATKRRAKATLISPLAQSATAVVCPGLRASVVVFGLGDAGSIWL